MNQTIDNSVETHPNTFLLGEIKTFGPDGPKYEVGDPLYSLENGDWMMNIILVETGEKVEYKLSRILQDPFAV